MRLGKYSIGTGDRFGKQGVSQLEAIIDAGKLGVDLTIVWNKSDREHRIIGSHPSDVRTEAENAITKKGWKGQFLVDADHINADTVLPYIEYSDFFTLDVASFIGVPANGNDISNFVGRNSKYIGSLFIEGVADAYIITENQLLKIAGQYLYAIKMAKRTFSLIEEHKGMGNFITEVSMDEVAEPQSPVELFFILEMIAYEKIPVSTIAPKFSGRFNKGVDYVGDLKLFKAEFELDLLVVNAAINNFGMRDDLKLSIHSGSDKFSIYPIIGNLIRKHNSGIHIKTAGTTWLEEVIGLALSGGDALMFVKKIYTDALESIDALCAPYADVIDIERDNLPESREVDSWSGDEFAAALIHDPDSTKYNSSLRQLIHVGYRLAADRINYYNTLLDQNAGIIGDCVYNNLLDRHIRRLFSA